MMENVSTALKFIGGLACGLFTFLFGGMDTVLILLLAFISLDYATGVLVGIYRHELSSEIGFNGLLKKVAMLIIVAVAHLAGQYLGIAEIRSFVIGFYIANEGISILENLANMDVPLPQKLINVLKQLKEKDLESE